MVGFHLGVWVWGFADKSGSLNSWESRTLILLEASSSSRISCPGSHVVYPRSISGRSAHQLLFSLKLLLRRPQFPFAFCCSRGAWRGSYCCRSGDDLKKGCLRQKPSSIWGRSYGFVEILVHACCHFSADVRPFLKVLGTGCRCKPREKLVRNGRLQTVGDPTAGPLRGTGTCRNGATLQRPGCLGIWIEPRRLVPADNHPSVGRGSSIAQQYKC